MTLGWTRPGDAWRGEARLDSARHGIARCAPDFGRAALRAHECIVGRKRGKAERGTARLGGARLGPAGPGKDAGEETRPALREHQRMGLRKRGMAGHDPAFLGQARPGRAWRGRAGPGKDAGNPSCRALRVDERIGHPKGDDTKAISMTTHPTEDLATEFLATRRRLWTAQLERLGVQRWRAHQLAAQLHTGADMRALLRELGGAVAVVGSLAASAVALFLL